jgi:hypothetical protein
MAFGRQQINNPTPQWVILTVRITSILLSAVMVVIPQLNSVPTNVKGDAVTIMSGVILFLHGIAPLFGVQIDSPSVPTKDVTAVKE